MDSQVNGVVSLTAEGLGQVRADWELAEGAVRGRGWHTSLKAPEGELSCQLEIINGNGLPMFATCLIFLIGKSSNYM